MKFALCNEIFENLSIEDAFAKIAEIGYEGVEIAPYTLKPDPLSLNEDDADRCLQAAKSCGLQIVGFHWLMAKTAGLHLTSRNPSSRQAACEYLKKITPVRQDGGKNYGTRKPATKKPRTRNAI